MPKLSFDDAVIKHLERLLNGRTMYFGQEKAAHVGCLCELIMDVHVENPAAMIDRLEKLLDQTENGSARVSLIVALTVLRSSVSSAVCGND